MKLFFGILIAGALLAADSFWETKPFAKWSDAEVHQLMSASPWAHEVAVADASVGWSQVVGGGGGRGGGHPANFSSSNPAGLTTSGSKVKAVVFWESALPSRQALARLKFGAEAAESREARSLLEPEESSYVILVTGLPNALVKQDSAKVKEWMAGKTTHTVKGRPALKASKDEAFADGKGIGLYFEFPRSPAISLEDKEVDFSTRVADLDVKTLFRLAEMTVAGKLEL